MEIKTEASIRNEIRNVEEKWKTVFSLKKDFNSQLIKWQDDILYDMYDHNQFMPVKESIQLTCEDFEEAVEFQKKCQMSFFKYDTRTPISEELLDTLKEKVQIDYDETYTMYLPEKHTDNWKRNGKVVILDIKDHNIENAIFEIEFDNYAKLYGEDFQTRKIQRYTNMSKENENLHYLGAFMDGKIAGACYIYAKDGYVQLDGLIVNKNFRKQYVATTLIGYAVDKFQGTVFLHADVDDTPKDMYGKMGFIVIDSLFEYTAKLE